MEVTLKHLHKRYGQHWAVYDLTLAVRDGEFVVLLGPSGCGKTSTLRMVAGLSSPDAGDVLFDGHRVNDLHPSRRDIAMVFQDYALYPHKTVYGNIAFNLRVRRLDSRTIRQKVDAVAQTLRIGHLLPRKPRELSGGERQRVALGRAMVRGPRLFLMDEPLSNLDARLREEMRVELKTLQRRLHVTTIYVTHDQSEAMLLADRIAVMNNGRLQQIGPPEEIYRYPINLFTATFVGSPRMNLLPGTWQQDSRGVRFVLGGEEASACELRIADLSCDLFAGIDPRIVLGFRPEGGRLVRGWGHDSALQLTIDFVEHLGADSLLITYLKNVPIESANSSPIIMRVGSQHGFSTNDQISLHLSPADIYVFDSKSESALFCSGRSIAKS